MHPESSSLLPSQELACAGLSRVVAERQMGILSGAAGSGKSFLLNRLCQAHQGVLLRSGELVEALKGRHPLAIEELFHQLVADALTHGRPVFVDDVDHLVSLTCSGCGPYPRRELLPIMVEDLLRRRENANQALIFCGGTSLLGDQAFTLSIDDFTAADYQQLCGDVLGATATALDFEKIFRFAPGLNAHQLHSACLWLRGARGLDTDSFIEYLKSQFLHSNVALAEVQPVRLADLQGVADVVRALEDHIILPLENDALAKQLDLHPKRGVLLSGPPGTGKTSVGRALAHRLKSKFFLADGTMICGTDRFYGELHWLFQQAKHNAPSILFIDDSDVMFESGKELALYRYLLTMLDGLESASAGRVCVMMTAMDIGHLPPALIRSGRIELWLEMRLPDAPAREAILRKLCAKAGLLQGPGETEQAAALTEGFSGADLKRLAEDAKILLATDLAAGRSSRPVLRYFAEATEAIRAYRERYTAAVRSAQPLAPSTGACC